jgi:hypothetical protein
MLFGATLALSPPLPWEGIDGVCQSVILWHPLQEFDPFSGTRSPDRGYIPRCLYDEDVLEATVQGDVRDDVDIYLEGVDS